MTFRNTEDLLVQRSIVDSYESIRCQCQKLCPQFRHSAKCRERRLGDRWRADEALVTVNGEIHQLRGSLDPDGDVLDILVQKRRDAGAALHFIHKKVKAQGDSPKFFFTDRLSSCRVGVRDVVPDTPHHTSTYANINAEDSRLPARHEATRARKILCWTLRLGEVQSAPDNLTEPA